MPETKMDINSLYNLVLRETESDILTELDSDFYQVLAAFIGDLHKQEYDGVESKIKDRLIEMATELTRLLLKFRLEKATLQGQTLSLLDEEKYILDSHEQQLERTEKILNATIQGKSKFLAMISNRHRTKKMTVRFLQDVDELVGADLEKYGPFKAQDVATIPYENAHALFTKDAAIKINWED